MASQSSTDLSPATTAVEDGQREKGVPSHESKKPWYKRKKIVLPTILAAIVVVVVTVTVPVVVLRNKNRNYSTGLNGAIEMKRATGPYTDVVVFGDGHADNGREREEQYAESRAYDTLAAYEAYGNVYWKNRWTKGPTWPEFLHGLLQTNQSGNGSASANPDFATIDNRNYAYGWSQIVPTYGLNGTLDLGGQVDMYLEDLANNSTASDPSRRSLVCVSAGMLDVYQAWERYLSRESPYYNRRDLAIQSVQQAAPQLMYTMQALVPTDQPSLPSPDFVILPLHPLELSPRGGRLARMYGGNVGFLRDLTVEFNKALIANARVLSESENSGNVYTVDVPNWLYNTDDPFRTDGCLVESCWGTWWSDAMHLDDYLHRILAEKIGTAMLGYPVSVDQSMGYSQYYTGTELFLPNSSAGAA